MPDLYDTTLTVPVAVASTLLTDRQTGHRMTMRLWDEVETTTHRGARAQVGCLWTVTGVDPVSQTGVVLIRSQVAPTRAASWAKSQTTTVMELPAAGGVVSFGVTIAAMYTPASDVPPEWRAQLKQGANGTHRPPGQGLGYRNKQVPVPADRLDSWAAAKLDRLGLDGDITATPTPAIQLKGAYIHTAHLRVTGAKTGDALDTVLREGIGKGRAYGLGLIVIG